MGLFGSMAIVVSDYVCHSNRKLNVFKHVQNLLTFSFYINGLLSNFHFMSFPWAIVTSSVETVLTLAVLVLWIFHGVMGGGRIFTTPPSNSVPRLRSDVRQAAFESSTKITETVLSSFLWSGQRSGQQR